MSKNSSNTTGSRAAHGAGWFLNLICFVAVICVGISLLLSKVGLSGQVSGALALVAQVISYLVLVIISCFYIVRRKNIWLWIIWAVSVALIIIALFL